MKSHLFYKRCCLGLFGFVKLLMKYSFIITSQSNRAPLNGGTSHCLHQLLTPGKYCPMWAPVQGGPWEPGKGNFLLLSLLLIESHGENGLFLTPREDSGTISLQLQKFKDVISNTFQQIRMANLKGKRQKKFKNSHAERDCRFIIQKCN